MKINSRLLFFTLALCSAASLTGTVKDPQQRPVSGAIITLDTVTQAYRFDGIHKVNPGTSYRIPMKEYQAIRFLVRADNIFNQTYFENGFLTPGRTAMGGVQFEF